MEGAMEGVMEEIVGKGAGKRELGLAFKCG